MSASRAPSLALLCVLALPPAALDPPPLELATSLPPHAWLIGRVAGPEGRVSALVGPGESPHTFQPTDAQITQLARSVLFFRAGVAFENGPWLHSLQEVGAPEVVDLRQGIEMLVMTPHSHAPEDGAGQGRDPHGHGMESAVEPDPHIWLSPRRLVAQARTIETALARVRPASAAAFRARRHALEGELEALDRELGSVLAPLAGRAFIVFHPAWGYFADDYDLEQIAIEIEGKQPSEAELTELARLARRHSARTIFVQPQVAGTAARAVADAVGAAIETLDPLAPDILSNLRQVARKLDASLRVPEGSGP